MKTEGTLVVQGLAQPVTGSSWMDHEFGSSALAPGQVGWDWFSLQFDDGTELMLYLIRQADGRPDPHSAGTWVDKEGRASHLRRPDFAIEVLDRWASSRTKGVYPSKWRLRVPGIGLEATVVPAFPDQELDTAKSTQVIYWEGAASATGAIAGRRLRGRGYVEMTGYAAPFKQKL
jgi:predicted secreted hydrolase